MKTSIWAPDSHRQSLDMSNAEASRNALLQRIRAGCRPRLIKYETQHWFVMPYMDSASLWSHFVSDEMYVIYMLDFKVRHPIMWLLWYRWWLLYSLPKELRQERMAQLRYCCLTHRFGMEFAIQHPILSLVWMLIYPIFKLVVKLFTAPVKAIFPAKGEVCEVRCGDIRSDDEFANNDAKVPTE